MRNVLLAVIPLSTGTGQALAWGDDVHRIVREIAYGQCPCGNPQTDPAPTPSSTRFRNPASIPISRVSAHPSYFMNFSRIGTSLQSDEWPDAGTWVLTSILNDVEVLAPSSTKRAERLIAHNPVGHGVGDIHRPLYGSFEDDRGGNNIRAIGQRPGNLYVAWDACLVEIAVGERGHRILRHAWQFPQQARRRRRDQCRLSHLQLGSRQGAIRPACGLRTCSIRRSSTDTFAGERRRRGDAALAGRRNMHIAEGV